MKNIVIAIILSLSAAAASADVAATKGYVDRATNATLSASKAYTDSQIGTSRSETDPTVAMTNGTIYIKGQMITPVTEHQDVSGKQDKLPYPTNAIPPSAVSGGVLQQENDPHVSLVGRLITIHGNTVEVPEGGGGGVDTNAVRDIVHAEIPSYESVSNSALSAACATNDFIRKTGGVIQSDNESAYLSKLQVKSIYGGGVSITGPNTGVEPSKITMTCNGGGGLSPVISLEDGECDKAEITIGTMNVRSTIETKADAGTVSQLGYQVASNSNRLDFMEGYISGQRVRISVTNYYGNTSGELPRMRIEEFVTETNVVDGVSTETNYWRTVWDEQNKYDNFKSSTLAGVASITNGLQTWCYQLVMAQTATKAPRAWGTLTSTGEAAPAGSVWHTEPNTVFAGGTEYAHAMVGTGVIGVLTTKGAAVYTDGETGRFHFTTDDRTYFFGMSIATRYELGCATDGITVTQVQGANLVSLTYNVTMSGKPILYYTPNLTNPITWEQITDSSGAAIPGATVSASWEQSAPAGSEICDINCGSGLSGFFKATIEFSGTSKFETNMMADLAGGIIATNMTSGQSQPIEPYIQNGSVLWRIKQ